MVSQTDFQVPSSAFRTASACAASLAFAGSTWRVLSSEAWTPRLVLAVSAVAHLVLAIIERFGRRPTENARQAAAFLSEIRVGPLRAYRDGLIIAVGVTLAFVFIYPALALVPALVGLYLYEHAYIRAAQLPPLS